MSHGGKRAGAGRKKGSLSTRTQEIAAAAASGGITPLEFMLSVLRDDKKTFDERFKAAIQAAPYIHPRLASVEHSGETTHNVISDQPEKSTDDWASTYADDTATH